MRLAGLIFLCFINFSCSDDLEQTVPVMEEEGMDRNLDWEPCDSYYRDIGYIYEIDDQSYLWAGEDSSWHFNITDWELNECNLGYCLGRESFPALTKPQYETLADVSNKYGETQECLVLYSVNSTKVYPFEDMIRYEVINEISDGQPLMVTYCVLADFAAVYSRVYCDNTLTFALSGYTYYEPEIRDGRDGFVLWDRDTESLWWPLIDKAISGDLHGTQLKRHDEGSWEVLRWSEIKETYPDALVIRSNLSHPLLDNFPRLTPQQLDCD